jgi:hypothetical protein
MGVELKHVSVSELDRLHEKLAGAFRVSGLTGDALDKAIAAALTPSLREIEAVRQAEADRRSRVKLVKD